MPGCNCPGQACGCTIQPGPGVTVEGTGTVANPFVVSLDARAVSIDQTASGVLDLSSLVGDVAVTVNVSASITDVLLPDEPGTRLDIFLRTVTAGNTIAWPSSIRWNGGITPIVNPTVDAINWIHLRQATDFWAGIVFGAI